MQHWITHCILKDDQVVYTNRYGNIFLSVYYTGIVISDNIVLDSHILHRFILTHSPYAFMLCLGAYYIYIHTQAIHM